jgi:homoserine O-succinyltransferase
VDWAGRNTHSTIWSCLAAHAALLHSDGIVRRRLAEKRFGVFEYERAADHPLTAGTPMRLPMPHSRWNDIPESDLRDCGYTVLTRSRDGGVDAFARQGKSLFVFFQGHPEYEANTLLLEYRRDVRRYLSGERDTYPAMPVGYFDQDTTDMAALAETKVSYTWHSAAVQICGNWLEYLRAQKPAESRLRAGLPAPRRLGAEDSFDGVTRHTHQTVDLLVGDH